MMPVSSVSGLKGRRCREQTMSSTMRDVDQDPPEDKPVSRPVLTGRDFSTGPFIETAIRIAALGLLLYWTLILVRPFVSIIIWSAVLTITLYPVFERTARLLGGRRRLAAAVVTIVALLVVLGPATWLAVGLLDSLRVISERLDLAHLAIPPPPPTVKTWPLVGTPIYQFWDLAATNFAEALARIAPQLKSLGGSLLRIGADAGFGIVKFLVSIVVAGFLFSPAPMFADALKDFARRLNPDHGEEFAMQAAATIRAVARGVIGISVLQALLAGVGFMAAGIPQASLLTFAALILGIVQIGPSILIIPVIIWSWTFMDTGAALLFTAYMIPVGLVDNVLRPLVMGRGLKTPMPVILIGVIGGTIAYGITGLFLGPIVLAVIWELVVVWTRERDAA
jgi:predicted PurR-regulated permease PerM